MNSVFCCVGLTFTFVFTGNDCADGHVGIDVDVADADALLLLLLLLFVLALLPKRKTLGIVAAS